MRILLISPLPPPVGGIAAWTVRYRAYCKAHNIPLSIVNNALRGARAKRSGAGRRLWDEILRTAYILRELHRQLRRKDISIVHINTSCSRFGVFRDLICALMADGRGIPVIVHCDCNIQDQLLKSAGRCAFKSMAKRATRIITLNRYSFEYAEKYAPGKAITIPNFIEEQRLCKRKMIRERIERVVFTGNVKKSKGICEIISAARALPHVEFVIIGPVKEDLNAINAPENVQFSGSQGPEAVLDTLSCSDLFLFPSHTEGFSNALLEAMAVGLPVIATDVGANREMLEEKGGVMVPVGDSDAIVNAIRKLDGDATLRAAMAKWNVEKVRSCYLRDTVMQKLFDIYEESLR